MRNQVTYNAGRNTSVSAVATASPPMMAYAIGPQKTVGAMGIMPNIAAVAVNRMGRKRCEVASMTAFHLERP